jgi:hypothetical protein
VIGTPSTYSMTKYGRPEGVVPAANTRAMRAWFMIARVRRSDSKRASTSSLSMPRLTSLIATRRRGSSCQASKTSPIPPSSILRRME